MDGDGRAVYVSVCGRVERIEVSEMSLDGLQQAVSTQFDIGDRLRFVSDEEGEPEVTTDDQLKRLAMQRHTLRVLISDAALSDLEQRMWQLRQLQWGFFQDELARVKGSAKSLRNELAQMRQVCEQTSRKNVDLAGEVLAERQARERAEAAAAERHDGILQELRREQRARELAESALRKDMDDIRQTAMRLGATAERQAQELRSAILEEKKNRSKNIESLLSEWAGSQAEIRQAIEVVRDDAGRARQDVDTHKETLQKEASAREELEKALEMKVRSLTNDISKVHQTAQATEYSLQQVHVQNARLHNQRSVSPSTRVRLSSQLSGGQLATNGAALTVPSITTHPGCATPTTPVGLHSVHHPQAVLAVSSNKQGQVPVMLPSGSRTPPPPAANVVVSPAQQHLGSPLAWQKHVTSSPQSTHSSTNLTRAPIVSSSGNLIATDRSTSQGSVQTGMLQR
eukprot:TRINITY_DN3709_c0_g1_i1.p1 TRINITY_DN3709_c0_g1~~TRINITY_DN3709_c0_g1_i1.p1  ORF type:complete len:456 (-),score=72.15 TRINITY_DN3709_c0_g1_i1:200-1567(-)